MNLIDVVTGANVGGFLDYEMPGVIPFRWRRDHSSVKLAPEPDGLGLPA